MVVSDSSGSPTLVHFTILSSSLHSAARRQQLHCLLWLELGGAEGGNIIYHYTNITLASHTITNLKKNIQSYMLTLNEMKF